MKRNFEKIELNMLSLVQELRPLLTGDRESDVQELMDDHVNDVQDLIEHGEYGVALENLLSLIVEDDIPVSREISERIKSLADAMKMDLDDFKFLIIQKD